ncbi:MAG: heavy metal-responsive transcriptional regulator [Deltaproteobacteria bacterium]|nr:heavy metal-responsive transcriptional regulator [Deltaproteobacteria bacterium]
MSGQTIGTVAKQANVHVETLRYYERRGLLTRPLRSVANYRLYPEETVRRVRFIKHAQALGFSLQEIRELLTLRAVPRARCADVRVRAKAKITAIDAKIRALQAMRKALATLVTECVGHGPISDCPILEALDTEEEI